MKGELSLSDLKIKKKSIKIFLKKQLSNRIRGIKFDSEFYW